MSCKLHVYNVRDLKAIDMQHFETHFTSVLSIHSVIIKNPDAMCTYNLMKVVALVWNISYLRISLSLFLSLSLIYIFFAVAMQMYVAVL